MKTVKEGVTPPVIFRIRHKISSLSEYEVCPKNNKTGITNSFFQFQTTNYVVSPSYESPSTLMHFLIIPCHASMYCWKDSSGMLFSLLVTVFLKASKTSKRAALMIPWVWQKEKSHTDLDQMKKGSCSSTTICSRHPVSLLFRHVPVIGENLPNTAIFHALLTCNQLNS